MDKLKPYDLISRKALTDAIEKKIGELPADIAPLLLMKEIADVIAAVPTISPDSPREVGRRYLHSLQAPVEL